MSYYKHDTKCTKCHKYRKDSTTFFSDCCGAALINESSNLNGYYWPVHKWGSGCISFDEDIYIDGNDPLWQKIEFYNVKNTIYKSTSTK